MEVLLEGYSVNRPTWFYLSLLLILAVYFRFNRLWSLRNLDLVLLLSASPGLVLIDSPDGTTRNLGYGWLFTIACLFMIRMLLDPILQRRPHLGQNMNVYGLGFLCVAAFAFLMTQAVTENLPDATHETVERADELLRRSAPDTVAASVQSGQVSPPSAGPAASSLAAPVVLLFDTLAPRILAILAHAAVISGLWFVGRNLFADPNAGLAMATLYLLVPATAYNVGEFNHVLPAALIVWALVFYRKPIVSGVLLGLACGTMFFPVFLLPIWAAFYGRRGAGRFVIALLSVGAVLLLTVALTSADTDSFLTRTLGTINWAVLVFNDVSGHPDFWQDESVVSVYRLPMIVSYLLMLIAMTIWPRYRSVETLIAQSTAAVVGTQLWYTQQGGVFLLWYLPLVLIVTFRPRLLHLSVFPPTSDETTQETTPSIKAELGSRIRSTSQRIGMPRRQLYR